MNSYRKDLDEEREFKRVHKKPKKMLRCLGPDDCDKIFETTVDQRLCYACTLRVASMMDMEAYLVRVGMQCD